MAIEQTPGKAAPGSPEGEQNEQNNMAAIGAALKQIATLLQDIHGKVGAGMPPEGDTAGADNEHESKPMLDNMGAEDGEEEGEVKV